MLEKSEAQGTRTLAMALAVVAVSLLLAGCVKQSSPGVIECPNGSIVHDASECEAQAAASPTAAVKVYSCPGGELVYDQAVCEAIARTLGQASPAAAGSASPAATSQPVASQAAATAAATAAPCPSYAEPSGELMQRCRNSFGRVVSIKLMAGSKVCGKPICICPEGIEAVGWSCGPAAETPSASPEAASPSPSPAASASPTAAPSPSPTPTAAAPTATPSVAPSPSASPTPSAAPSPSPPPGQFDLQAITLSASPASPKEGDSITIDLLLMSSASISGVKVDFYVDGSAIDRKTISLQSGVLGHATASWTASIGSHSLKAAVDPLGEFSETNESNNNASKEAYVMMNEPQLASGECDAVQQATPSSSDLSFQNLGGKEIMLADLNGDGRKEAVKGTTSQVIASNYSGSTLWTASTGDVRMLAKGDFNNDGKGDVVAVAGNVVYAINGTGTTMWSYASPYAVSFAEAGDVNGDGGDEVAVGNGNYEVLALSNTGAVLWTTKLSTSVHSAKLADVNGDGKEEIAVGGYGKVFLLKEGSVGWERALPTSSTTVGFVEVGEYNAQTKEVVAFLNTPAGIKTYALNSSDGYFLWSRASCGQAYGIAYGDEENSGGKQFVYSAGQIMYVLNNAGGLVWYKKITEHPTFLLVGVSIGDVDGDGKNEVVAGAERLFSIRQGSIVKEHRVSTLSAGYVIQGADVGDMNGDGTAEIIATQGG